MVKRNSKTEQRHLQTQSERAYRGIGFCLLLLGFLLFLMILTSCRSVRYVEVPVVSHDTAYIAAHQRDSIRLHDSIWIRERGDTVRIEHWHTEYRERTLHDTLYYSRTDTVQHPYPVEVEVERQLTWWQRTRMTAGTWALIAALLFILYKSRNMVFAAARWLANLRR